MIHLHNIHDPEQNEASKQERHVNDSETFHLDNEAHPEGLSEPSPPLTPEQQKAVDAVIALLPKDREGQIKALREIGEMEQMLGVPNGILS